jgi:xanthine dehydrogenase molybdenum-binding subunit
MLIAAVAAIEPAISADTAAQAIEVDYEVRQPISRSRGSSEARCAKASPEGNLLSRSEIKRGDVESALEASAHVVTHTFQTQFIEHMFLEPERVLRCLKQWTASVHPRPGVFDDRRQIASFMGMSESEISVTLVSNGGAFGGKEDMSIQAQTALLAKVTGSPVKLTLSREESLRLHPKRHQ